MNSLRYIPLITLGIILLPSALFASDNPSFQSLSNILNNIIRVDRTLENLSWESSIWKRFLTYRWRLYEEGEKTYPLLPPTWGLHPTLDTTLLYEPYIQKYSLSCEIAAVRMVMQSFWKRRSEESIFWKIPHFPGPLIDGIWGDPDHEFVWDIKWTQGWKTGFWIYEFPLLRYLKNEWFEVERNNNLINPGLKPSLELTNLLNAIKTGSRVILWGDWCTLPEYEDGILSRGWRRILPYFPLGAKNQCDRDTESRKFSWQTPEWKRIDAVSGEHTFILLGYIWEIENPSHIIVWDTYTGRHIFPREEWMRKWELLNYRNLIINK